MKRIYTFVVLAGLALVGCPQDVCFEVSTTDPRYDRDGDGYCESTVECVDGSEPGDCDDGDWAIHPGAVEVCGDGIDWDCSGDSDDGTMDQDGDGDLSESCSGGSDCDDTDPSMNSTDADEDGLSSCEGDCDDHEPLAHPDLLEVCNDWIDNDCDGTDNGCALSGTFDLAAADAKLLGEAETDHLAYSRGLASAGDVDGDGFDDLLVGARYNDEGGPNAGAAYLVTGPVQGTVSLSNAEAKLLGENENDVAGYSVSTAGDQNGDGLPDLLVGAYGYDTTGTNAGIVYVVYGPDIHGTLELSDADARLMGEAENDYAGFHAVCAGDVDGDGTADLLVGAQGDDTNGEDSGAVYLVYGPVSGEMELAEADAKFVGENAGDAVGKALSPAGDLDGDGAIDDLVLTAEYHDGSGDGAGAAYVLYDVAEGDVDLASAQALLLGVAAGDNVMAVSTAGDVDGDGIDDLLLGAHNHDGGGDGAGIAYLLYDQPLGIRNLSAEEVQRVGEAEGDGAGWPATIVGDVNGDGFDDVLIGAHKTDTNGDASGTAYLEYGPLEGTDSLGAADVKFQGEAANDHAGVFNAAAGDMNDDGYDDIAVSAYGDDTAADAAGAVYIVYGRGL